MAEDLKLGRLTVLASSSHQAFAPELAAIHRADRSPGRVGRRLLERLKAD